MNAKIEEIVREIERESAEKRRIYSDLYYSLQKLSACFFETRMNRKGGNPDVELVLKEEVSDEDICTLYEVLRDAYYDGVSGGLNVKRYLSALLGDSYRKRIELLCSKVDTLIFVEGDAAFVTDGGVTINKANINTFYEK